MEYKVLRDGPALLPTSACGRSLCSPRGAWKAWRVFHVWRR